jgi:signal transduction histidine kinase
MKLAAKILLPLVAGIVVISGLLIWRDVDSQTGLLTTKDAQELENHYRVFTTLLDERGAKMFALADSMANIPHLRQAFAARDREGVARLVTPSFQALREETEVTNFHFHVPPATSFLRVHEPDNYGDDLSSRPMVVAVNAGREPLRGVEAGQYGLAISGMVPIRYRGQHTGSVECGQFIRRTFLEHVKQQTQADLTVYVTEEMATTVMSSVATELGTDAPQGFLVYASTGTERLPIEVGLYQEVMNSGHRTIVQASSQGHSYSVMLAPLLDYEGHVAAVVEFTVSRDAFLSAIASTRDTSLRVGGILVAGLALGLGLYILWLVLSPVSRLRQGAERVASGDLEHRVDVRRGDEIGMLASAFNTMAERLGNLLRGLEEQSRELQARSTEVAERTREMEASQRVTFAASERTTPDALLDLVVNLIRDQFHLYHAQVYLVDQERQAAVLCKSTGYAGRRLLQRQHQIPLDRPALVTKAIREGQPVLLDDTRQDPDFLSNPLLPHTRSELVVPLKLADRVIGVLDAQDRVPGRFSESTVALFQTMANQIAFLFENSDLLDSVTEQSEALTIFATQLRTAADIARKLGSVLDPDLLLQQMVDLMQSRFGLYHAHVYVLESPPLAEEQGMLDGKRLTVRAGSGEVGRVLRERGHSISFDHPQSLVARAARTQETVVAEDTTVMSGFMSNPLLPQTRSEMAVPLVAGDQLLGVLDMQDDQPGRFTETEVDTFTTLAGQIGTALQTAALFSQVQARFRVSQALAGTQTENEVLNAIIQVASFYPGARASIYTIDPEVPAGELAVIAQRDESFDSGIAAIVPIGTRFTAAQFPLLRLISVDESFVSPNLSLDERAAPLSRETAAGQGVASAALLPLAVGGEWLGVLALESRAEGYFDERKLHLYQSLVEQGALALRTGRLFDETQQTAERLREVDRLKSEFLSSMSHELRTPLNSIIGFTEIMLMGIDGELPLEAQEDVQAIYDNGQHLLRLINDVLDLAKIEAGYLALSIEEVPIVPLIEDVKNNVAGLVLNKPSVEFVVEIEGAEAFPPIQGDELRLTQILNNLISNAVKFTDEGAVTLRAYQDHPHWICLEVEDSGIGISADELEKIFDRFHQVDSSESRRAGGTGLGLPITRHLIELHGGTIDVRSQLGVGSVFAVRLPATRDET